MKSDTAIVVEFGRFAASGYKRSLFKKDLYLALTQCFGFIAHFDHNGFYDARFGSPAAQVDTLALMGKDEVDHPLTTLERQLRTMVVARGLADAAVKHLAAEVERAERAELTRLKAKYEEVDPLS